MSMLAQTKSAATSMRSERDRFVALSFCWADLLFELDHRGNVVYLAGAVEPLTGVSPDELIGHPLLTLIAPAERAAFQDILAAGRRKERVDGTEIRLTGPVGITPPMSVAGYQLCDFNGHYFLAFRRQLVQRKNAGFGRRSRDPETGLCDGESFINIVTETLAGQAIDDRRMSLIVMPGYEDLRHRLVEETERQLLVNVSEALRESSIDGDSAARLGDDRYGVIHDANVDIESLRGRLSVMTKEADPLAQGVSVEAATVEIDPDAFGNEEIAKGVVHTINQFRDRSGKEFNLAGLLSSMSTMAREAVSAVESFKSLIVNGDFSMAFQPIINARTGAIHHYEALARFPEQYGPKSPFQHIVFAEETGLITDFDLVMVEKLIKWMSQNVARNSKTCFAVNLSGHSVGSLSFIARLTRLLRENSWVTGRLVFEVTESSRMVDLDSVNTFVQRVREQGFEVGLDDFGAGAANFQYLSTLDVDFIKIDGLAVNQARQGRKGKAFLRALVGFCRELGISTVAEMVEDAETLNFVRECGVKYVQGHLFGTASGDLRCFNASIPSHLFSDKSGKM